jgi:hypothetical protein
MGHHDKPLRRVDAPEWSDPAGQPRQQGRRSSGNRIGTSGVLSYRSLWSVLSATSVLSVASAVSVLSIGSFASVLSIGSSNSILSIGSDGGFLSIGKSRRRRIGGPAPGAAE